MEKITDNNSQTIQNDVIDLRESFAILKRRKKLILSITTLFTLLVLIYVLVKQPIYEVKSNVMVGYIDKDKEGKRAGIAESAVIAKRLNIVFSEEGGLKVDKFVSKVSSVSINKNLENFITIKTEAISNEEALKKNKEVVDYLKNLYQSRIDRYIVNTDNDIKATEVKISNLENLETKNIQRKIKLLQIQKIVKIDEKIKFYKTSKLNSLKEKIKFHTDKLEEYTKSVKQIYQNYKQTKDSTALTISSIQMVNYQNLILNSQNKVEDLKIEIETINNETMPNLHMDKENIQNDTLRKLEYELNVELPYKKVKLQEHIEQLKYNKSEQNIQNSKVIGEFVIKNHPIKPKKKLIIIVAFITGLMFSIFLAFFLEFLRGMKREEKDI